MADAGEPPGSGTGDAEAWSSRPFGYTREVEQHEDLHWFGDDPGQDLYEVRPPAETTAEAFHFTLHGGATARALAPGRPAELWFELGAAAEEALALLDSEELDAARRADLTVELQATGYGDVKVDAPGWGSARFHQGRLQQPVRFGLRGVEAGGGPSGVHVAFSVGGERVYSADVPLSVQAADAPAQPPAGHAAAPQPAGSVPPLMLKTALRSPPPPAQRVELTITLNGGMHLRLAHYVDGTLHYMNRFDVPALDRPTLHELLRRVYADLDACYEGSFWNVYDGSAPPAAQAASARDALLHTARATASAGALLYTELKQHPPLDQVLAYIEDHLGEGGVITVCTEDVFLPWEIMYPRDSTPNMTAAERQQNPVQTELFWGARWAIETFQLGQAQVGRLRQAHCAAAPGVSVLLNPTIYVHDGPTGDHAPLALLETWAARLQGRGVLAGLQRDCEGIRQALKEDQAQATFFYVYCHGVSAMAGLGATEALHLDDECRLEPRDLPQEQRYGNAPVVFLNACSTGTHAPQRLSTFLSRFRALGALGLIATTASVPAVFGAHFGTEVVEAYLGRGSETLARALWRLRRRHLQQGNAVPLFYTLQCQL